MFRSPIPHSPFPVARSSRAARECSNAARIRPGEEWQRLRDELTAWLQRRFRRVDAANIAGDAVFQAMLEFGAESEMALGRKWSWLCRVSINHVYRDYRRAKRCDLIFASEMGAHAMPTATLSERAERLVREMLASTRGVERQVLEMLREGSPTNEEMSACLGVDRRTIERSRASLRRRFLGSLRKPPGSVGPEHL